MIKKFYKIQTLYLVKSGLYYKIGITDNILKRLQSYYTHNPDVSVISTRKGCSIDEKFLHQFFLNRIIIGEWMKEDPEIIRIFNDTPLPSDTFKDLYKFITGLD